jgi:2Fe-2S ferredoxin
LKRVRPELVRITLTDHLGTSTVIEHAAGCSVMEAAVEHEVSGIEAQCYGAGVCGTCHVLVEADWFEQIGAKSEWEQAMLDALPLSRSNSRLSCQIVLSDHIDGARFVLPEHQESLS